jgi:hypothetical protein
MLLRETPSVVISHRGGDQNDTQNGEMWPFLERLALLVPSVAAIMKGLLSGRTPSLLTFLAGDT